MNGLDGFPIFMPIILSMFADQQEATKLICDSPYAIPLYNDEEFSGFSSSKYYDLTNILRNEMAKLPDSSQKLPIEVLISHLNRAKYNFQNYFLFPGESRRDREYRNWIETATKLRFIDWYKKTKNK